MATKHPLTWTGSSSCGHSRHIHFTHKVWHATPKTNKQKKETSGNINGFTEILIRFIHWCFYNRTTFSRASLEKARQLMQVQEFRQNSPSCSKASQRNKAKQKRQIYYTAAKLEAPATPLHQSVLWFRTRFHNSGCKPAAMFRQLAFRLQ